MKYFAGMTAYFDDGSVMVGFGTDKPPGWTGQHTNVNRPWFSVCGAEWEPSSFRTMHELFTALYESKTVSEFLAKERENAG